MSNNQQVKQIPTGVLNEYLQMGLNEQLLKVAWTNCKGQEHSLLDEYQHLLASNDKVLQEQQNKITNLTNNMDEENQIAQAILDSVQEAKDKKISFEPLNPEQRTRKEGIPVGLKNLGNTCYINPLLQVYFYNVEFASAIINYQKPSEEEIRLHLNLPKQEVKPDNKDSKEIGEQEVLFKRVKASVDLVSELQQLYILLVGSDKKYIDPSNVIKSIVDEQGNQLQIGDQQDIGEFNLTFLARVEEGLQHSKNTYKQGKMDEELTHSTLRSNQPTTENEIELKRSVSIAMSNTSIVSSNFFGKNIVHMSYPLGEEIFVKEEEELFNIIFLDIKHKEFYYALDEYVVNHIDEFKNDRGDIVSAQKHNWIRKAPKTLLFQLQRVIFDKERCQLKKLNDPFQIEQEIYIERFTEDRSKEYLKIRENVKNLIAEKQQYEKALQEILTYSSSHLKQQEKNKTNSSPMKSGQQDNEQEDKNSQNGCSLLTILESATAFLSTNSQKGEMNLLNSVFFGDNSKENNPIIKALEQYTVKVKSRISELETKISQLQNKISESYNQFKKDKYILQSVLIHDGQADSGHYYAFIQDIQNKKWWRYNDIQVSEETVENVLKEAVGGWGKASAYSLIYVKEEIAVPPQAMNKPLRLHLTSNSNLSNSSHRNTDYYTSLIPEDLLNSLCADNLKFYEEIEEYKTNNSVRIIMDNYTRRFELNNECSRKGDEARKKARGSPPPFIQFCVYLKLHPSNDKGAYDDIIKWLILDSCVREQYKNQQSLNNLTDSKLEEKLRNQITSLGQYKAPKSLKLPNDSLDVIELKNSEFIKQLNNAETTIFVMQTALKFEWISSLSALDYLMDLNSFSDPNYNFKDDYFFKITRDTKLIILIAMLHYYELLITHSSNVNSSEILVGIQAFISFYKKQFKYDSKTQLTFQAWIEDIISSIKDYNLAQQLKQINTQYMSNNNIERYYEAENLYKNLPQELIDRHDKLTTEGDMYYWNVNKKEDCLFNELISNFGKVKDNFMTYINFTMKFRNTNIPFFKQDRVFSTNAAFFNLK